MIEDLDSLIMLTLWGIPINATILFSWMVMLFLVLVSWLATRHLKTTLHVSKFQTMVEMIVLAIRGQVKDVANDEPMKYMPLVGTFFLFIGLSNLLTIFPFFKSPTASLTTTVAFSLCVFVAMPFYGIKSAGLKGYLKKYTQPTPLMLPMNILSDISSTFSLAFRLYGNVLSGVVIGSVLLMMARFIFPIPMQLLGLLTGTIQAYIFALLAIVYISNGTATTTYVDPLERVNLNAPMNPSIERQPKRSSNNNTALE